MPRRKIDYFSADSLREGLAGKTVRGGAITAMSQVASIVISLLAVPALAYLLDPADFGLVGMVAVLTNFARMFVDAGLPMATIQREEITHPQVSNLFWVGTFMGWAIAASMAASAPLVAMFYGEPRLVAITLATSLSLAMAGMTLQHQALLRRGMQFREMALISVGSAFAGQAVAIAWAWWFYQQENDYWALVLMPLVQALVRMLITSWCCDWTPGWMTRGAGTWTMLTFGSNLMGFNFVNYFARNLDNILIGWWWGAVPLGYYDRAYRLLLLPIHQLMPTFTPVVVPALSRLRDEPDRYRRAYMATVRPFVWLGTLFVGLLWAISDPLVLLYMGSKWAPVVPMFAALMPACWSSVVSLISGWCYSSWGHVDRQLRWVLYHSAIAIAAIAICLPWGPLVVAYGVGLSQALLRIPAFYYGYAGTPIHTREVMLALLRPAVVAIAAALMALFVLQHWLEAHDPAGEAVVRLLTDADDPDWWRTFVLNVVRLLAAISTYCIGGAVVALCLPGTWAEFREMLRLRHALRSHGAINRLR